VAGGVEYLVPDVIIETEPDILHVFVDPKNKTVVDIEVHGKRSPMPTKRPPEK